MWKCLLLITVTLCITDEWVRRSNHKHTRSIKIHTLWLCRIYSICDYASYVRTDWRLLWLVQRESEHGVWVYAGWEEHVNFPNCHVAYCKVICLLYVTKILDIVKKNHTKHYITQIDIIIMIKLDIPLWLYKMCIRDRRDILLI